MKPDILAIVTSSLLLAATTGPLGQADATPVPRSAISGIGEALPSLSSRDRRRLTERADGGDLNAMYELAHHALLAGGDDPMGGHLYYWWSWKNPKETESWWNKAAARGDPKAMILLGHMYAEPWGVAQELPKAGKWFEKAADLNSLEAVQALVDLYMGAWSDERDDAKANHWLMRAVSMGDHHAMLILGLRYDAGWGIRENPAEAARWYEKVIAGGWSMDHPNDLSTARNNLGALYEDGRGVPKDERKAAEFYSEAAHNWSAATYNLAVLCESGRGVHQDKAAAIRLYREAAARDMPEAIAALNRLNLKNSSNDREYINQAIASLAHEKQIRTMATCSP